VILGGLANETNSRRAMKSCDRELDDVGFQGMGGEGTFVPGWSEANLCRPKDISTRLFSYRRECQK
jgi:hypothetical protein